MNWAEIKNQYSSMCASAPAALSEWAIHATEANQRLCSSIDVQELEKEFEVGIGDGEDYADLPSDVFHVRHVDNTTIGRRMEPEAGGMRGRSRYLDSASAIPPEGQPLFYVPSNKRLYVRPTADGDYTLRVWAKVQPDPIDDADLGMEPLLPRQYHMVIAREMAKSFLLSHPATNRQVLEGGKVSLLSDAIDKTLSETELPKDRERFDQNRGIRIPGFVMRFR